MKALLCLLALLTCSSAHAQPVLRFLSWQDYFDPAVIEDFNRAPGFASSTRASPPPRS